MCNMAFTLNINGTKIEVDSTVENPAVYNVTVDVIRITKTVTSGGQSEVEDVAVNDMPAHIKWLNSTTKMLFNKQTWILDAVMNCRTADILITDRIRYNGDDFEIKDIMDFNNLGTLMRVALKRVE